MGKPHSSTNEAGRESMSRPARYQDLLVGLVVLVMAGLLLLQTYSFPAVNWTPLGLAFWPRIVLGGIAVTCLVLIVLRQLDQQPILEIRKQECALFAALAGFVIALPVVGFFVTCTAYVFATSMWLGRGTGNRVARSALFAISTTALVYIAFTLGLGVSLPQGRLNNLVNAFAL